MGILDKTAMGRPIRVLVVDDSVVIRRCISNLLDSVDDVEVVATAANGKLALDRILHDCPDIVLLDMIMPVMDGIGLLKELQKQKPDLPVIVFSSVADAGAVCTMDAFKYGARECVLKPSESAGLSAETVVLKRIVPLMRAILRRDAARPSTTRAVLPSAPTEKKTSRPSNPIQIVSIGSSTGGPNALAEVIADLPDDLETPVVIAQHMPHNFTAIMAERLNGLTKLSVAEGTHGEVLCAGQVRIAPGGYHMVLKRRGVDVVIQINEDPPENSCRPAVDPLFRSVVDVYGRGMLAVVLTGMGSDGLKGCEAVRAAGGSIMVQDEETSVVWGMPGYVAEGGLADTILPINEIGMAIGRQVARTRQRAGKGEIS